MNYFTPELFIAFNSGDAKTAKRASIRWDQAVQDYDHHLKSIRRKLPPALRRLSKLYLHDAEYLSFGEVSPSPENRIIHLAVRQQRQAFVLLYFPLEEPLVTPAINHPVFSERAVSWLYDEIDVRGREDFSHEILFSNGRTCRFRFHHLAILTIESAVEGAPDMMTYAGG